MKTVDIQETIANEVKKLTPTQRDNVFMRSIMNSQEELGADGVLEDLKDFNRYSRGRSSTKQVTFPELTIGFKGNVRAGKKSATNRTQEKKGKVSGSSKRQ